MARRGGLTVKAVENLQARGERYEVPDPGCAGLYLQIRPDQGEVMGLQVQAGR